MAQSCSPTSLATGSCGGVGGGGSRSCRRIFWPRISRPVVFGPLCILPLSPQPIANCKRALPDGFFQTTPRFGVGVARSRRIVPVRIVRPQTGPTSSRAAVISVHVLISGCWCRHCFLLLSPPKEESTATTFLACSLVLLLGICGSSFGGSRFFRHSRWAFRCL